MIENGNLRISYFDQEAVETFLKVSPDGREGLKTLIDMHLLKKEEFEKYGIIPDEEVFLENPNLVEIFSRMAENPEKFCREQLERAQNKQITK